MDINTKGGIEIFLVCRRVQIVRRKDFMFNLKKSKKSSRFNWQQMEIRAPSLTNYLHFQSFQITKRLITVTNYNRDLCCFASALTRSKPIPMLLLLLLLLPLLRGICKIDSVGKERGNFLGTLITVPGDFPVIISNATRCPLGHDGDGERSVNRPLASPGLGQGTRRFYSAVAKHGCLNRWHDSCCSPENFLPPSSLLRPGSRLKRTTNNRLRVPRDVSSVGQR